MLSIDECREDGRLWIKFKEAFRTWLSINHSDFLTITDSEGKYPQAEEPTEPTRGSSDVAQKIYLEEYRACAKETKKFEESKPQIYGALYGSLAECSQVKIREDADWKTCESHLQPLKLFKLVEKVHLRPRSTGIAENDQDEAADYYNNLRQAASEPLHEYHQKITAALDTLKAIGAPIPTAEEQGRRVVKSLDPSRYADYQMRLHNRLVEGERDVYPKTLDAAFDIASKLLRTTHARDQPQSTMQARVLVAEQSHKRDKKHKNRISDFSNNNKNDRSTNNYKNKSGDDRSATRTPPDKPSARCKLCDKTGHWIQHCPKLDEARDTLKKGKAEDALLADEDSQEEEQEEEQDSEEESFEAAFVARHDIQVGAHVLAETSRRLELSSTHVLLDSQATYGCFSNSQLLDAVGFRGTTTTLRGIGDGVVTSKLTGNCKLLGVAL